MTSALRFHSGLDHFALRAADFDATLRFYQQALGFTIAYEWTTPGVIGRCAFLDSGNGSYLELFDSSSRVPGGPINPNPHAPQPSRETRAAHNALLHVCLRTDDVDTAYAHALANGAERMQPPVDLLQTGLNGYPDVKARLAFVYGLDGEVIEFQHSDFAGAQR